MIHSLQGSAGNSASRREKNIDDLRGTRRTRKSDACLLGARSTGRDEVARRVDVHWRVDGDRTTRHTTGDTHDANVDRRLARCYLSSIQGFLVHTENTSRCRRRDDGATSCIGGVKSRSRTEVDSGSSVDLEALVKNEVRTHGLPPPTYSPASRLAR